jgi:hypothetical protein
MIRHCSFLAYLPYFENNEIGFCKVHAACESPLLPLNKGTNLYETWYVYHST